MGLTFKVPIQYCSLQHWPCSITSHIHNWVLFLLWLHPFFFLELFLHCSPVAYQTPTNLGSSSFSSYLFAFSYCLWDSQGKNTEVSFHSFLLWAMFCQNSPPWPSILGGCPSWVALHCMAHSFIELDKSVVHVDSEAFWKEQVYSESGKNINNLSQEYK